MPKFERNPSRSFPEKPKNKLPDFPLLIYRYHCLVVYHQDLSPLISKLFHHYFVTGVSCEMKEDMNFHHRNVIFD